MPARNKAKWLTVESLKSGLRETAVLTRGDKILTADLYYDEVRVHTPFVVRREVIDMSEMLGNLLEQHLWWFASLDEARTHWTTQVYQIKG